MPFFIDDDDLAVDQRVHVPVLQGLEDGVKALFEVLIIPGAYQDFLSIEVGEGAIAIPFYFVYPSILIEGFIDQGGEHGGEVFGHGRLAGGGPRGGFAGLRG